MNRYEKKKEAVYTYLVNIVFNSIDKEVKMALKKKLDKKLIVELAHIQCTNSEIAAIVGCNIDTLHDRFSEVIAQAREAGHESLRRAQWKKAVHEGNPSLLMWLGRFYLKQREEMTFTSTEPEVRALLEKWEVVATKKSFSQLRNEKSKAEAMIEEN